MKGAHPSALGRKAITMTPDALRQANIEHFRLLLEKTSDASERSRIERLCNEERLKPDSAYPPSLTALKLPILS